MHFLALAPKLTSRVSSKKRAQSKTYLSKLISRESACYVYDPLQNYLPEQSYRVHNVQKCGLLDQISETFPDPCLVFTCERECYAADRRQLMDEVPEGALESFERTDPDTGFSYRITANTTFDLEVIHDEFIWTKTFGCITDSFEIGGAA